MFTIKTAITFMMIAFGAARTLRGNPGPRLEAARRLITYEDCYEYSEGGESCHLTWGGYLMIALGLIGGVLLLIGGIVRAASTTKQSVLVDGEKGSEREARILNELRVPVATVSALTSTELNQLADKLNRFGTVVICPADDWADMRPFVIKGQTTVQMNNRRKAQVQAKLSLYSAIEKHCGPRTAVGKHNSTGLCAIAMNNVVLSRVLRFSTQAQAGEDGKRTNYTWNLQINQGEVLLTNTVALAADGFKSGLGSCKLLTTNTALVAPIENMTQRNQAQFFAATRSCNFTGSKFGFGDSRLVLASNECAV